MSNRLAEHAGIVIVPPTPRRQPVWPLLVIVFALAATVSWSALLIWLAVRLIMVML